MAAEAVSYKLIVRETLAVESNCWKPKLNDTGVEDGSELFAVMSKTALTLLSLARIMEAFAMLTCADGDA